MHFKEIILNYSTHDLGASNNNIMNLIDFLYAFFFHLHQLKASSEMRQKVCKAFIVIIL